MSPRKTYISQQSGITISFVLVFAIGTLASLYWKHSNIRWINAYNLQGGLTHRPSGCIQSSFTGPHHHDHTLSTGDTKGMSLTATSFSKVRPERRATFIPIVLECGLTPEQAAGSIMHFWSGSTKYGSLQRINDPLLPLCGWFLSYSLAGISCRWMGVQKSHQGPCYVPLQAIFGCSGGARNGDRMPLVLDSSSIQVLEYNLLVLGCILSIMPRSSTLPVVGLL